MRRRSLLGFAVALTVVAVGLLITSDRTAAQPGGEQLAQAQVKEVPKGLERKAPTDRPPNAPIQTPRDLPPIQLSIAIQDAVAPKPGGPGSPGPQPGSAQAVITVRARAAVGAFVLRISTRGVATTPGAEGFTPFRPEADDPLFNLPPTAGFSRTIPKLGAGEEVRYTIPLRLTKFGQGEVLVATAAVGEAPAALSTTAHDLILIEGSEVIAGGTTFTDVRVKQLRMRMQASGAPDADIEAAIRKLRRGGARTSPGGVAPPNFAPKAQPAPGAAPAKAAPKAEGAANNAPAAPVTVRGQVRFTDRAGGTHPVRFAYVVVRRSTGSAEGPDLAQGYTDGDGNYSLSFAAPGGAPPFDVYLVPHAFGDTIAVRDLSGDVHAVESEPRSVVPGADNVIDVTAAYDTTQNVAANWAFAAYEAANYISRYPEKFGRPRAAQIDVYFPLNQEGAYYNGAVNIALTDAHDWDVVMHEYGHHLESLYNFAHYTPGPHYIGADTCELQGKPNGVALAWGEGWPTFNGTMAQRDLNLGTLGIPTVGDTSYTDRRPGGSSVIYDLDTDTSPSDRGEGDEVAVQRVMWDHYHKGPHLTPDYLWKIVVTHRPNNLSDCWDALSAGRTPAQLAQMGEILSDHGMAAAPILPAEGAGLGAHVGLTFEWSLKPPGTACDGLGTSRYTIRFYKADFSDLLLEVPNLNDTTFTPDAAQLAAIRIGGVGAMVRWGVFRHGLKAPQTGDYPGSFRTLTVQ